MKKISEGNKGIQALAKENPALVEDKFGYDVPGYFMGGMPGVDMGGMPGVDEAVDDAQEDLDEQNKLEKLGEILSMAGNAFEFSPLVEPSKVAGIDAIIPKIRRPDPETLMPQGFRRGGMPGGLGSLYERDFITDDFNIKDYINNVLGGGTASQLTEEERLAKGYGASGAMGGNAYRGTTPGADVTIDARSENPAVYKFYPSEVSKLYSQMKGVPFSPLVAPPKEATFIDALQPKKIASQLYAKDGTFVDRDELITGPGGERGDKIPAMLSDGEFVVNAAAVRGIGIQAGADPDDEYEQRLLGAREMYEMQKLGEEFAKKLA